MNSICPDCNADIPLKGQLRVGQIMICPECQTAARLISLNPAILESLDATWEEEQPAGPVEHNPRRKPKKQQARRPDLDELDLEDGTRPRRDGQDRSKKKKRIKRDSFEDFPLV